LVEVAKPKKTSSVAISQISLQTDIIQMDQIVTEAKDRLSTGFQELDRVLGGGLLAGSVTLLGGEPGVGKSTLLLQVALNIGGLYVTAEESGHQVKLRANRLKDADLSKLSLLSTSNIDQALAAIQTTQPTCAIIDSIQTVSTDDLDGVPGSIGQVRECANRLVHAAKNHNIPIIIVSHVTKEGTIAGPKVLEHVVDTVLYVEGESLSTTRLVRGIKNRFGPVHEVGLFELSEQGMAEITDPTGLLADTYARTSGSVVTVSMEGIRPVLLEVQGLTVPTSFGLPRRTANGMDYNRLLMLIAVLTKRTKLALGNQDVYTNLAGGLRIRETALDLAVCLALVSSLKDKPLPERTVVFGEVSLAGEVKPVIGQAKRQEQAKKLGYKHCISSDSAQNLSQAIKQAFGA
jgi:DNA repair protein RadA/Sms